MIAQYPQNDNIYEDHVISEVHAYEGGWTVTTKKSMGLFVPGPSPVEPVAGTVMRTYGRIGDSVRGIFLDGQKVYYRTEADQEERHRLLMAQREAEEKGAFERNKAEYDRRNAALPDLFQRRLMKFRLTNPDFRWKYESYELFCCEQAVLIAGRLKTADAVREFVKKGYAEQKAEVPELDDGHSGNTFGMAARLAYHYLSDDPENVVKEHGALSPLVGCDQYGCAH